MPTANDLVSRALRRANILATGQTAESNDSLEALDCLNDILDQWSLEDLMIIYTTIIEFPLVAGQLQYSIGAGGDIDVVRPIQLVTAWFADQNDITYPLGMVDFSNYQAIVQKISTTNTLPEIISYQPAYPLGQLYLWQTPSAGLTLKLEVSQQFIRITDLSQEIDDSFPVGFIKAMVDSLAYELAVEYGHLEVIPMLKDMAMTSKMNIKRKNTRQTAMSMSSMFTMTSQNKRGRGTYNFFSDSDM